MTKFHPQAAKSWNAILDRIAYRLSEAGSLLSETAAALDGSEAVTLKGLSDLRWAIGTAMRSLDMAVATVDAFESELLIPGGTLPAALADRNAARIEASVIATVQAALAGKNEVRA